LLEKQFAELFFISQTFRSSILFRAIKKRPQRVFKKIGVPEKLCFLGKRRSKEAGESFSLQRKTEQSELCSDVVEMRRIVEPSAQVTFDPLCYALLCTIGTQK